MTENAEFKARRYLVEGRLELQRLDGEAVLARCLGTGATSMRFAGMRSGAPGDATALPTVPAAPTSLPSAESSGSCRRDDRAAVDWSQWAAMMRAPLKDHSYQLSGLGPAVADFLAGSDSTGRQNERSTNMSATSRGVVSSSLTRPSKRSSRATFFRCCFSSPPPRGIGRARRGRASSSGRICGSASSETRWIAFRRSPRSRSVTSRRFAIARSRR